MTEDQLEQETLCWLADVGYTPVYGPEIAVDGNAPERSNYTQVVLVERLRKAIDRLNPLVPLVAREDALQQVLNLDTPVLLAANRQFHRLLIGDKTRNGILRTLSHFAAFFHAFTFDYCQYSIFAQV